MSRNGCRAEPVRTTASPHVAAYSYPGCRGNAQVTLYMIEGGGHAWPGGLAVVIPGFGESTTGIDATSIMWEFFEVHLLTPTP